MFRMTVFGRSRGRQIFNGMENEIQNMEHETPDDKVNVNNEHLGAYIVAAALIIAGAWVYTSGPRQAVVLPKKYGIQTGKIGT